MITIKQRVTNSILPFSTFFLVVNVSIVASSLLFFFSSMENKSLLDAVAISLIAGAISVSTRMAGKDLIHLNEFTDNRRYEQTYSELLESTLWMALILLMLTMTAGWIFSGVVAKYL